MREVLSYSRRGSRFTPSQAAAWEAHAAAWVIPDEAVDDPGFALADVVRSGGAADRGDRARGGGGDRRARRRPPRPRRARPRGVATGGGQRPRRGRGGRRDQRPVLLASTPRGCCGTSSRRTRWRSCGRSSPTRGPRPATTSGAWSTPTSPRSAASRLRPGGRWRLATDWADYAAQMREVLDGEPRLDRRTGGAVVRAAGDEVRAQGTRRRAGDHRPGVRPGMRPASTSCCSTSSRATSRSTPSGMSLEQVGQAQCPTGVGQRVVVGGQQAAAARHRRLRVEHDQVGTDPLYVAGHPLDRLGERRLVGGEAGRAGCPAVVRCGPAAGAYRTTATTAAPAAVTPAICTDAGQHSFTVSPRAARCQSPAGSRSSVAGDPASGAAHRS